MWSISPSELWIRFKFQELSAGQTAENSIVVTVRFHRSLIRSVTTVDAKFCKLNRGLTEIEKQTRVKNIKTL